MLEIEEIAANPKNLQTVRVAAYARVSADKDACENGGKVTVTVDASAIEGETPPDIQVEFDANRLNFENCSVEYGGGGGGLVTFKDKQATVEFTTLSGGDATVNVTATAEDAPSPETASVTIAVNGYRDRCFGRFHRYRRGKGGPEGICR